MASENPTLPAQAAQTSTGARKAPRGSGAQRRPKAGRKETPPTTNSTMTFAAAMAAPAPTMARIPKSLNAGPRTYAVTATGDCLEPKFFEGDTVVCDPDAACVAGDFVAVWWREGHQPQIKRLSMGLPPRAIWDSKEEIVPMLAVEMLNPPKRLMAPLHKVEAVHKVIHRISAGASLSKRAQQSTPSSVRARVESAQRLESGSWYLQIVCGDCGFAIMVPVEAMQPGGVAAGDNIIVEFERGANPLIGPFSRVYASLGVH